MTGTFFYLGAVALVAIVGLALAYFMKPMSGMRGYGVQVSAPSLTKTEFVVGLLLACLVVIPATTWLGTKAAQANATTYNEFWSGKEKAAHMKTITCTKDGPCRREYNCDPYEVQVTKYRTETYPGTETYTKPDGSIGTRSVMKTRQVPYQDWETRYHDCPYVTEEYTYTLDDTLGETYEFGSHLLPASPEDHRWTGQGYERRPMPNVAAGIPSAWADAKARIDAGTPGGTTKRATYKNYILASAVDAYADHADAINAYKAADLMPKVADSITGMYGANKAYAVGATRSDLADWTFAVQRLNGYLGEERQGDLHVVLVGSDSVGASKADEYSEALAAYWQSEELGRNTLSKNGIAVILGVAGSEITWSRAFTGMPVGNEDLVDALSDLAGGVVDADAVLDPETGSVANLLLEDGAGFVRVEMKDYEHLADNAKIGPVAKTLILLAAVFLSLLIWAGMLAIDLRFSPLENIFRMFRRDKPRDLNSDLLAEVNRMTATDWK